MKRIVKVHKYCIFLAEYAVDALINSLNVLIEVILKRDAQLFVYGVKNINLVFIPVENMNFVLASIQIGNTKKVAVLVLNELICQNVDAINNHLRLHNGSLRLKVVV